MRIAKAVGIFSTLVVGFATYALAAAWTPPAQEPAFNGGFEAPQLEYGHTKAKIAVVNSLDKEVLGGGDGRFTLDLQRFVQHAENADFVSQKYRTTVMLWAPAGCCGGVPPTEPIKEWNLGEASLGRGEVSHTTESFSFEADPGTYKLVVALEVWDDPTEDQPSRHWEPASVHSYRLIVR